MAQQAAPQTAGPSSQVWEGDATLHSYCYDYMRKRGWSDAASRFAKDAGINEDEWRGPPIEAPQGLLYEWWSVFWDVFIARSQKSGQRNANADAYVEAMRAKREPLVVQFSGPNAPPPMTLPRSLAHPPRSNSTHPPSHPPRANYSQMHVLEQQELQNQMQQRGRAQQQVPGQQRPLSAQQAPPPQVGGYPPSASQQQQPPPHSGQPQGMPSGIPQPLMQPYPPQQNPQQPGSAHNSPLPIPASHPYANGRPQGPPGQQQQQQMMQGGQGLGPGQMSSALAQAMAAVGLPGRDPDSLSPEEHAAVAAQMRRMGALPPLPPTPQQTAMRTQQGRMVSQSIRQDSQGRPTGPYVQQGIAPQDRPTPQQMQQQQQQQQQQHMMHPVQQQQQAHMMAQQQRMMQSRPMHEGGSVPPQAQYGQSQIGSPASPAYSAAASPYATPLVSHMQIPPAGSQNSPSQFSAPLPPPSRSGTSNKNRVASTAGQPPSKGSPAQQNPKRAGGNVEEPSPRSRKRARGSTREEEMQAMGMGMGAPETPNFDGAGGPGSPNAMGLMPGGQVFGPDGIPYRPSPSPLMMQPSGDVKGRPPQQGQHVYVTGPSEQYGDISLSANGAMNGQPPTADGSLSRPASAASSHHFLGAPPPSEQRGSPVPTPSGNGTSPNQFGGSLPPGMPGAPPGDIPTGGARPFAGAPQPPSASTTPLLPAPQALPPDPGQQASTNGIPVGGGGNNGDASLQFNVSGDDMFAGLDFDSFLNNDMFNEELVS
ncbi:hypothetical protein JCM5296_005217 [Sporobolomyces johnsonii]